MGRRQGQSSVNVRELVLDGLLAIEREQEYSHVVIGGILDKYNYLEAREKAFLKRLMEGVLERRITLDYAIDRVSSVPVRRMKPLIRELMRMSAYQILFMDAVPDSAVCNEAVRLAQQRGFHTLKGFVNGVLRSLCRNRDKMVWPDREQDRERYLSVRYSMPCWLIRKWDREQGREQTEGILEGLLAARPVTVRIRDGLTEEQRQAVREELEQAGIEVRESGLLPCAWHLEKSEGMRNIPAFSSGLLTVQDIGSMLAVEAAGIGPDAFVMDVCAAPGGKTMFAAQKAYRGRVLARDSSERRLALLEEARRRLGAENVTLEQWDGTLPDETRREQADVVLVDAPCSGLGVIGRKRDIKYRMTKQTVDTLAGLQKQILEQAQQYVKPGGVLVYSTCTISRAENEDVRRWFLDRFPFRAESLEPYLPEGIREETISRGYVQLLPGLYESDGFFIARFVRE